MAAPVAGLLGGWSSAVGVVVGALVVTAFFCLSGVVIAWAGRIDDALTLPAALGTFLVKALVFFAVLSALPADGWVDRLRPGLDRRRRCPAVERRPGPLGVDPPAVLRAPAGPARVPSPESRRSRSQTRKGPRHGAEIVSRTDGREQPCSRGRSTTA